MPYLCTVNWPSLDRLKETTEYPRQITCNHTDNCNRVSHEMWLERDHRTRVLCSLPIHVLRTNLMEQSPF